MSGRARLLRQKSLPRNRTQSRCTCSCPFPCHLELGPVYLTHTAVDLLTLTGARSTEGPATMRPIGHAFGPRNAGRCQRGKLRRSFDSANAVVPILFPSPKPNKGKALARDNRLRRFWGIAIGLRVRRDSKRALVLCAESNKESRQRSVGTSATRGRFILGREAPIKPAHPHFPSKAPLVPPRRTGLL